MNVAPVVDPFSVSKPTPSEPLPQATLQPKNIEVSNSASKQAKEVKKLDFDFGDTDDFFNSFTGPGVTKVEGSTFGNEFTMEE